MVYIQEHSCWVKNETITKQKKIEAEFKKTNIFTIIIYENYSSPYMIICYNLLLVSSSPDSSPGWWVIIVSPLRGSRYRVLNVPLWPVCSGYKCPLRCLLEPGLQGKVNYLCITEFHMELFQKSWNSVKCKYKWSICIWL